MARGFWRRLAGRRKRRAAVAYHRTPPQSGGVRTGARNGTEKNGTSSPRGNSRQISADTGLLGEPCGWRGGPSETAIRLAWECIMLPANVQLRPLVRALY